MRYQQKEDKENVGLLLNGVTVMKSKKKKRQGYCFFFTLSPEKVCSQVSLKGTFLMIKKRKMLCLALKKMRKSKFTDQSASL